MVQNAKELLTALISEVIFGSEPNAETDISLLSALYALSSRHDLVHIAALGLEKRGVKADAELHRLFTAQKLQAAFRREQLDRETDAICALLEREGIDYIPLKGSVIKHLYPEKWLRTGSDIDILIRECKLEQAITAIESELGYYNEGRKFHEHSLISKSRVHLELHFSILENNEHLDPILGKVWEYAYPKSEGVHEHILTNEYLIFHTVAHAMAHFIGGGCGMRPVLDLAIMLGRLSFDGEKLDAILHEAHAEKFYDSMTALANAWFFGGELDETAVMAEEFILGGGQFGSTENYAAVEENRKGGRVKYLLSRIFETTPRMKAMYPILNEKPYLLPYCHIKRWVGVLNPKKLSSVKKQLGTKQRTEKTEVLFFRLGLK